MVWYNPFSWKKQEKPINHSFNDDDRQLSLDIRRKRAEITKMKLEQQAKIEELKLERERLRLEEEIAELSGDDEEEDELDGMLYSLLAPIIMSKFKTAVPPTATIPNTPPTENTNPMTSEIGGTQSYSDLWEQLSDVEKGFAKGASDYQIRRFIISEFPEASREQIDGAISFIRSK